MPTKIEELGLKMAKTLLNELAVLPTVKFQSSMDDLLENVPSEGKFFMHQEGGQKVEPTKEALLHEMLQDQKSTIAFCCVSLQTDTRLTFDIDHVFPRELITKKQKLLLNYLNDYRNAKFTKAFMGEDPYDFELQTQINKYFRRDPKDNNIKGTRWFFDVCYNNLSNIFHLKHYLNRGKSAATPKEWFEKNFPSKFMEELIARGGINEGIIMQQIFPIVGLDSVDLGIDTKGNPVTVYLHEGIGIGLGNFVRHWFQRNASDMIESSKEVHAIQEKLTKMLTDDLRDPDNNKEGLEKFLSTINEALKIAEGRNRLGRESSTDSEEAVDERKKVSYKAILWAFEYMHSIKQMKKQVLEIVAASDKDTVKRNFYSLCADQMIELTPKGIEIALDYFQQRCNDIKQAGKFLMAQEVETIIVEAGKKGNPEERLKIAEDKAAKEAMARKLAEDKAVEETKARMAVEARLAELEAQLPPEKLPKLGAGSKPMFRPS